MDYDKIAEKIEKAKKETGAVVLAHTYQPPEILRFADIKGDSFLLSQKAAALENDTLIVCGVRFMAETAKILSPGKRVILPSPDADCPMAGQIAPSRVAAFKKENPDTAVCAYINTSAALKAECDFCVTSSSAVKIVKKIKNNDILFIPDKNLGAYVAKQVPEKNIITWDGYCPVHNSVTPKDVLDAKNLHPDAKVAAHPECPPDVLALADMIGSTSAIIAFIKENPGETVVVTERGVVDSFKVDFPDIKVVQPCCDTLTCPDMKKITPEILLGAITGECGEEIELEETLRLRAKRCIDRMLEYGG